jgi:hypothetical protein
MLILPIDVFVIETPGSSRSKPLLDSLEGESRIATHVIPSIMVSHDDEVARKGIFVDREHFWSLTNRHFAPQEIGCAASHNLARGFASKVKHGAIILEDDARILDLEKLIRCVNRFLIDYADTSSVLSLTYNINSRGSRSGSEDNQFFRLFSPAPLAVAYAVTTRAADQLKRVNVPIVSVSDWPDAKVKFYCLDSPLVGHGDEASSSTIDPNNELRRTKRDLSFTVKKWLFVDYLFRARGKVGFREYSKFNFVNPILYYYDRTRVRFFSKARF